MIAIHGIWNNSEFHLWGEDSALLASKNSKSERAPRRQRLLTHPYALPPKGLHHAAKELSGGMPPYRDSQVTLVLPSGVRGPLASPGLLCEDGDRPTPKALRPWAAPSLTLGPAQALELLTRLPAAPPHGVSLGASLRFWAEAAKLSLELLAQGQFLPDVEKDRDGRLRARWRPAVEGDGVSERMRLLAKVMPPVCRACDGDHGGADDLTNSFLAAVTDGWIRQSLRGRIQMPRRRRDQSPAEAWFRPNLAPKTAEGYEHIVRRHLMPAIGSIPLSDLKPTDLQSYYARKLNSQRIDGKGVLSAKTVQHHHRTLHDALEFAVKWGRVSRNVAAAADPPRPGRVEMQFLDQEAVLRFLEGAKRTPYYALMHLAVSTGARRSELLGLAWKHVDMDMATISIVRAAHHLRDGSFVFREPKSVSGRRVIDLPPAAVLVLRQHREQQECYRAEVEKPLTGEDLLFCRPDGSPLLPDTVTHAFLKIARRAGLTEVRFHDLRHSHASLMLKQGVHPKIVQERLGHYSIKVTLDTYSHVAPGLQRAAAEGFNRMLQPAPSQEKTEFVTIP